MKTTLFISLICYFSFGFIDNVAGQNQQNLRIERQIDSIFHVMIKAAENLDYDKLTTGVDDRYKAGFITGGLYYAQYDSLIKSIKTKSLGVIGQNITIQKEKITVLSDNLVLITASGITKIDVNKTCGNCNAIESLGIFIIVNSYRDKTYVYVFFDSMIVTGDCVYCWSEVKRSIFSSGMIIRPACVPMRISPSHVSAKLQI